MKQATKKEKQIVHALLKQAFMDVPGLKWVTGNGSDHEEKLNRLLDASIHLTLHQGEIWLSEDEQSCCLWFYSDRRKLTIYSLYQYLRIAFGVIGWRRIPEIFDRERYIRAHQPTHQRSIYVWYIAAAEKAELESIIQLKNALFYKAYIENLPITMETTVSKVALTFQRYGFEITHRWQSPMRGVHVWFLHRLPGLAGITTLPNQNEKKVC